MFFMPYVLKRFNHFKLYDFFMNCWPFVFVGFPILHVVAKLAAEDTDGQLHANHTAELWLALAVVLAMSKLACLAYAYVVT
jgi:hypothetical protein